MKVLVTTAGRHGSTVEIGNAIAAVLRDAGQNVETVRRQALQDMIAGALVVKNGEEVK
jgi:menaquinone-dependent protoporphyrinogen IX oxidase